MKVWLLQCPATKRFPAPHWVAVKESLTPFDPGSPYSGKDKLPFIFPDVKELREYVLKHGDLPLTVLDNVLGIVPPNY